MVTLLLLSCWAFPCAADEWLDADGECHAAPSGASDPLDTADTGTIDTAETADTSDTSDAVDTSDTADTSDSGDTGTLADAWPRHFTAPYVDATAYPTVKLGTIAPENGVWRYTLGFLVAASLTDCTASWGTYFTLETGPSAWGDGGEYFLYDEIATLRAGGGDVMVSFGGAANTPIEAACSTPEALATEIERVIVALDLQAIDFDVEGAWLADAASVQRRTDAIKLVQAWAAVNGRPLHVWLTLPVLPSGLTADGVAVVQSAVDAFVVLDGVNLMTMDYGPGEAPDPDGNMGEYGITALQSTHDQLRLIWPTIPDAELWTRLGTTPMIGQNDVAGEVFDVEDAGQTRSFAEENLVGMLGFWSINRDHPCEAASEWARGDCTGFTDVPDWAFAQEFAGYGE